MPIDLRPPFHDLTFMSPLSGDRAQQLVRFLAADDPGLIVDLGCGWAELLLQTLAAVPGARGVGIDRDHRSIAHGRSLARARRLADRVELIDGDATTETPTSADALICIGASQIWGAPVEDAAPLDYPSALKALRALVPRGGRVVYGEAIWSRPPTEPAVASLGGLLDEFVTLPELAELAVAHGFGLMAVHEANLDEWDEFESGYSACYAAWLATHAADHPDAAEVRAKAKRQRDAYLSGYRATLGMAYLCLVAV